MHDKKMIANRQDIHKQDFTRYFKTLFVTVHKIYHYGKSKIFLTVFTNFITTVPWFTRTGSGNTAKGKHTGKKCGKRVKCYFSWIR
jgi:hypothetical protein